MTTPTPTYPEALNYLHGSLPANPELDDATQRALRVVVAHQPVLGLGGPEVVLNQEQTQRLQEAGG